MVYEHLLLVLTARNRTVLWFRLCHMVTKWHLTLLSGIFKLPVRAENFSCRFLFEPQEYKSKHLIQNMVSMKSRCLLECEFPKDSET